MRVDILSVVPELLDSPFSHSILKRVIEKGLAEIHIHNPRDFSTDKHKKVDDYQYGGGAGLVMTCQPIVDCIKNLTAQREYDEIIYMTPDGEQLNQGIVNKLSLDKNVLILCGHYKGIDQRIRDLYITREISIGDYVLSGGELGAAVLVDAILRVIPGAINNEESALTDSFQDNLLAPPVYTRPAEFEGEKVPQVLLSGDFPKINEWRENEAYKRTKDRRPDLLD
ncbi:MAG: tRNA (guanine37-N1)-methyltransferase [Flavobacteriales bacterium]|jgi:tRNA (guanine37-N1)-methyltransferase|tara:strand:+ start:668 stop:1342 length:675 start_codon:yes stop_codon:yes gene_type:complete